MDRDLLRHEVLDWPVCDSDTHLVPDALAVRSFWDVGQYSRSVVLAARYCGCSLRLMSAVL
jgi:hypothetical protein